MAGLFMWLTALALAVALLALLAEALWLVPKWKAMTPSAFRSWYPEHAATLLKVYGPLEVLPVIFALVWLLSAWAGDDGFRLSAAGALLFAVGVLVFFPIYFKAANASFEAGELTDAETPEALRTWGNWHWARTAVAALALVCALAGLAA